VSQKCNRILLVPGILLGLICLSPGHAASPLALYDATAQTPAPFPDSSEGGNWRLFKELGDGPLADSEGGKNFLLLNPSEPKAERSYEIALKKSDLENPRGWTVTTVLRVPEARDKSLLSAYVRVLDGTRDFLMAFVKDKDNEGLTFRSLDGEIDNPLVNLQDVKVSGKYVTAQMVFDPKAGETKFYVDGKLLATLPLEHTAANRVDTPRIRWGKSSAWGSKVHWQRVAFETGQSVISK
jgi:hypothetical protein